MEIGYVKSIKGPVITIDGLPSVKVGDLVESEDGSLGFVSALRPNVVDVMLVEKSSVRPGQSFRPSGTALGVSAGDFLIGRAIGPLGHPVDGKGPLPKDAKNRVPLVSPAFGISDRRFIREQFETGILLVDTIIPLGKGQRELVIGDARSGKTGFLFDVVTNQKKRDVVCVYGCIAKPLPDVKDLIEAFSSSGALSYTTIVASFAADPSPLIFLTPQTVFAVASYFQRQGKDVLVILDDMGTHARVYREISLLSERPPGREAYPGDIFYQHAHLLEKAGNFAGNVGGGSITALPVIELGLTDFTGFISTNLMSMTDGHLLFSSGLYSQGRRPAVDLLLSISRVGQQTQSRIQTAMALKVKQLIIEGERLSSLTSFSTELPPETRLLLTRKSMLIEVMRQKARTSIPLEKQLILLALPFCKFLTGRDEKFLSAFKETIISALDTNPRLKQLVGDCLKFSTADELITKLDELSGEIMGAIEKIRPTPAKTAQEVIQGK